MPHAARTAAHTAALTALCAAVGRSLSIAGSAMGECLDPIVGIALPAFQTTRASCCQTLLTKAVEVFGAEHGFVAQFEKLLEAVPLTVWLKLLITGRWQQ